MRRTRTLAGVAIATALIAGASAAAATPDSAATTSPTHHPRYMLRLDGTSPTGLSVTPPAPPCPVPNGGVPAVPAAVPVVGGTTVGPCVKLPEFPAAGAPEMGNMAYWGGRVQVHPHLYLVYFGWGRKGAFKHAC